MSRTPEATTNACGAATNPPFVTTKKSVDIQMVRIGVSQTALGDRRLLAALIDRTAALIGKTNTKPTSKLPRK
jgi:hypothetical protein